MRGGQNMGDLLRKLLWRVTVWVLLLASDLRSLLGTHSCTSARLDLVISSAMNYLKSITDAVLQSTGVSFPFSIGERIPGLEQGSSIWEIREGVKKVSSEEGTARSAVVKQRLDTVFVPVVGEGEMESLSHAV